MKIFSILLLLILSSAFCHASEWQIDWLLGVDFVNAQQYPEAHESLSLALEGMSEEEMECHPEVLLNRAYVNYLLNRLEESVVDCKNLLGLKTLNIQQKQDCYFLMYLSFWKLGRPIEARQAYLDYAALENEKH